MKINRIGKTSAQVLSVGPWDILVSYSTPVAAHNRRTGKLFRTKEKYSVTTSKQVNKFCDERMVCGLVEEVSKEDWDKLMAGMPSVGIVG